MEKIKDVEVVCNIWLLVHIDVHVHQPLEDHWIFQGIWEGEGGGGFWYP
jgi:hypothetical protein